MITAPTSSSTTKGKEKEKKVVSCDVKQQYPFEGLTLLNKIVDIIKVFSIPVGLPWHLTDEVYVPVNCNGDFHWAMVVVVLKERCIKVYDLNTNIMSHVKRKIEVTTKTTDTKIKKKPRTKTSRKKKENLSSTLLEELASETVSSSQVESGVSSSQIEPGVSQEKHEILNEVDGHDSYELIVKYLLAPLSPKINNLFGFPWAFMAWAFETIPHLRHQVTVKEEISSSRILRWLTIKNVKNPSNIFNPLDDAAYVARVESYVAADAPYVVTYHPFVAICDPNIATDDSYVATNDAFVETCDTNIATDDPCIGTYELYVATNDAYISICDQNVATDTSYVATYHPSVETYDPSVTTLDRVKRELVRATTIKRERIDNQLVVLNEDMVDADVRDGVNIGVGVDVGDGIFFGVGGQCVGATYCSRCSGFLCEKCKKYDDDSIMYLQTLSEAANEFKYKRGVRVISSNKVRDPYTPQGKRRKKYFIKAIHNLKKNIFRELSMAIGEKMDLKPVNIYKMVPVAKKVILLELMKVKDLHAQYDMHYICGNDFRAMTSMDIWWEDCNHGSQLLYQFQKKYDVISVEATTVGRMNVYDCNLMSVENDKFLTFIQPVFELLPILLKQSEIMKHLPKSFSMNHGNLKVDWNPW
ncbi:hypothetical protein H5410_002430 [Solanum commersonii]|uniref:Ubiquitin-like protease family profile domain-containing protein n=1 Tax=Solanum commersonii TaxID=4109 RepID=A0A9J6B1W9_SOLCO|nr:hypothetical protein H5410_002430 [Solanum commersonii]